MNDTRPTVYLFFDLPHCQRVAVLRDMGLVRDGWNGDDQSQYAKAFGRARKQGRVDDLRRAILSRLSARATEPVDGGSLEGGTK